jgi:Fic/DOC family
LLWKLNWIHPFADGNGRTARAVSYAVMSIKLDGMLPGTPTIPEQISANKGPYYDALEKADGAFERGRIDVAELEAMLSSMLSRQLLSIAVLSETSLDGLTRVMEFRVKRAPPDKLKSAFGTADLQGRLWQIGLDQVIFQLTSPEEVASAVSRNSKSGTPFPDLLAPSDQDPALRTISDNEDGSIFRNAAFQVDNGAALSLQQGISVGLISPSVSKSGIEEWKSQGALYIFRFGKNISEESIYEAIDLMIAKHLSEG